MITPGNPLQQKLATTRRWWRTTGSSWPVWPRALGIVIALALLCYHADNRLVLSAQAREHWRLAIAVAGLGTFLLLFLRAAVKPLPDAVVAAEVERRFPDLGERLLSTVDLIARPGLHRDRRRPVRLLALHDDRARRKKPSGSVSL